MPILLCTVALFKIQIFLQSEVGGTMPFQYTPSPGDAVSHLSSNEVYGNSTPTP